VAAAVRRGDCRWRGVNVQLVVTYFDHQIMYYQVPPHSGWRVDNASRCIVVGKFPRTYIPLDQVRSFDVEQVRGGEPT
jgi:hypothetical protein